ncbi:MAG: hypothetical protein HOU81_16295 [Hamadaea sp.]|uniref:hypothetical protein n=1 Tax=Hamadaea sp. TaxID=2024425 RepID=UPI0017A80B7E|nr:hypothetical protein [Hamadaea sp.]NUR72376.1 hypothetical protein [Hamadaea sp.]NUT24026.1 hypothetical protein [Hamadaea sp.]
MRIRAAIALGLLASAALAGCSKSAGDGVASANGTANPGVSTTATGAVDEKARALQFAKCMRENGVPNWPDPKFNDGGGVSIDAPEGADPTKVDAAMQACKPYLPNGGEPKKLDPARLDQLRKYAQCMREHGIKNFPDPTDYGFQLDGNTSGIDPAGAAFQAADKECQKYAPPPVGESAGTNTGSGK